MEKIEIVQAWEIEFYPELWDFMELKDDEYYEEDYLTLFEGDPDMLKIDDYITYFMDLTVNDTKYIITNSDEPDDFEILKKFFSDDFKESFETTEPNNWESWEQLNNGIAYRGGKGYVYTIWKLNN